MLGDYFPFLVFRPRSKEQDVIGFGQQDVEAVRLPGERGNPLAHAHRDFVTLLVAIVLREQVHLQVSEMRKVEEFAWQTSWDCPVVDCSNLPRTVSRIRVTAHYVYRIPLASEWRLEPDGDGYRLVVPQVQVQAPVAIEAGSPAILLTNPPYGERIGVRGDSTMPEDELAKSFYADLSKTLKQRFAGWTAYLFTADLGLPKLLRLKESRKTPFFNGALECRLFRFDMVAGFNRREEAIPAKPVQPAEPKSEE